MTLLVPGSDLTALRAQLAASPQSWLIACFCAAWCDTCGEYRPKLRTLSGTLRQVFAWIDIEDHAELLGEVDVENFPTLMVQIKGRVVFYGPMLPHIGHLERLLDSLNEDSPAVTSDLPDLPRLLAA